MDVRSLLASLALPPGDGYYRSRIPNADDEQVARVIRAFSEAEPGRQAVLREALDGDQASLLLVFSERLAALGVRLHSREPLVQGLVAASLAQECQPHDAMLVPPLHRRSAEKLGLDAGRVFEEAAGRTDLPGARWLADVREAEESPEDVGYIEDDDGEGFRYERAERYPAPPR